MADRKWPHKFLIATGETNANRSQYWVVFAFFT